MQLKDGTLLYDGRYRIVRFLAKGGFGCTYEAIHVKLNKRVAIKEFFVSEYCERDTGSSRVVTGLTSKRELVEHLRRKFENEAQNIASLDHPGIVHVTDIFDDNDTTYYVMDYIDGPSLREIVKQHGPLPESEAVEYIRQICDALDYVHDKKLLHLDIKPGNIMIDRKNRAVLIDFGVSRQYDTVNNQNTSTLLPCTPGFAPIEQMSNKVKELDKRTDVYALGATLYYLLTGHTPPSASEISAGIEELALPNTVSPYLRDAILTAMQLRKKDRPESVSEFAEMLTPQPVPLPTPEPEPEPDDPGEVTIIDKPEKPKPNPPRPIVVYPEDPEPKKVDFKSKLKEYKEKGRDYVEKNPNFFNKNLWIAVAPLIIALIALAIIPGGGSKSEEKTDTVADSALSRVEQPAPLPTPASKQEPEVPTLKWNSSTDEIVYGNHRYKMVFVEGGTFQMGATPEQCSDAYGHETPVHSVTLSDYYIGKTEVPQWLWVAVMGNNPSKWKGDNRPVEMVSWNDCQDFIRKLNNLTGKNFKLPTEAQWEFAARGGRKSNGYKYSGSDDISNVAWNSSNSGDETHDVARKSSNELGLYDMSGNVYELCSDWKGEYSSDSQTNPTGPDSGSSRVLRGGGWRWIAGSCRVSFRDGLVPDWRNSYVGFRLAL